MGSKDQFKIQRAINFPAKLMTAIERNDIAYLSDLRTRITQKIRDLLTMKTYPATTVTSKLDNYVYLVDEALDRAAAKK